MPLPRVGLYMRLSRDDEREGESMSIENQRLLLRRYAEEQGFLIAGEYVDDGYSGTDFERPSVKRLLSDAQAGKIDVILVKDLSRFGRNYIQVGQYLDYIFPACGIRFIALGDRVDTADRCSPAMDMMPIMNVFNEWHAASTSRKIRAALEASQRSGKYTNWNYPFGYRAGEDEKRTAVIDEEAARIVRRIFELRLSGLSAQGIARLLTGEGILNPASSYRKRDGTRGKRRCSPAWSAKTVMGILRDPTYLGRTTQHRTTRISYKNHKVLAVPEEEQIVREHAHMPIIGRETWERVQKLLGTPYRKADRSPGLHALSGLLVCPDCGKRMRLKRSSNGKYSFVCRTYSDLGREFCASHRIGEEVIETVLLQELTALSERPIPEKGEEREMRLAETRRRAEELKGLVRSARAERERGRISEEVFRRLIGDYQTECAALRARMASLRRKGEPGGGEAEADLFHGGKLTRELCRALVEKISVGEKGGMPEIVIFYRFSP